MEHYILKTLKEIDGIYEHKFSIKCGREYTKFPELDQLIIDGFIESFDKQEGFEIKGIRLTEKGQIELARLDAIPIISPEPTIEQLKTQELKTKLQNNSITFEETKELLRVILRL